MATVASVNVSKTYARLTNGQIIRVCADKHSPGGVVRNPKPYRNKREMKAMKRARRDVNIPF